MLAHGLAECFEGERINDGKVLGRFNLGLLDSPIVRCDEGVPQLKADGTTSVDQAFRSLVSGGALVIEGKMMNPINANIFPRIMFTSNDREILRSIVGSRDLTNNDRQAIELRLLSIEVDDAAQRLLESKGNYAYTRGWVHGDVPSRYVLANHIYWLFQSRKASQHTSGRLLVEGPIGEGGALASHFRDDPAHQLGVKILVKALQPGVLNAQQRSQMHVDSTGLYFLEALFDASSMETDFRRPASKRIDAALNESGIAQGRDLGRRHIGGRRGRWRHVADWAKLLESALDLGLDATSIEQRIARRGAA